MPHATTIWQQKSLLLFDLDGTLVDSAPDLCLALNRTLADFDLQQVTLQQVRDWVGQGAAHLCTSVLSVQNQALDSIQQQQFLTRFLQYYQQDVCVKSRCYPAVHDVLQAAKADGKIIACITNKPYQPAWQLLEKLALLTYFDMVIGGDTLPQRKPSPQPLLYVMAHYQKAAADTLMIGDSKHDIMAAHAAGVDCIAVSYGYNHGEPIGDSAPLYVIDNLAQLISNDVQS